MRLRALFISYAAHLGKGGGVQQCTMEYLDALRLAGISVEVMPVKSDDRLWVRVARKFYSSPYFKPISLKDLASIRTRLADIDLILLNQVALSGALVKLGSHGRGPACVLLSHGCEITDLLHAARLGNQLPLSARLRPSNSIALGSTLSEEMQSRRYVDGAIAISHFDAECEEWLGTRHVIWIPRTIKSDAIDWSPKMGCFGYVGTLDHAPNLEGLVAVLEEAERRKSADMRVRIVGGPASIGRDLAGRFTAAEYLGNLDESLLAKEACTWSAFLHPIFCLPRGCSTKLATALAWRIPVITTSQGRRGYVWSDGTLIERNSAEEFVTEMERFFDLNFARAARAQTIAIADSSPKIAEVAATMRTFLSDIQRRKSAARRIE